MIIMSLALRRRILHQTQSVPTFVTQAGSVTVGIDWFSCVVEIFGAHMKRLMNVPEIMGQQNYRNRFRNLARIIRGNFTAQNGNAVRNCMHDIPVATSGFAIAIFLDIKHRHVGVMHPMMGWRGVVSIRARLDLWMRETMNSTPLSS